MTAPGRRLVSIRRLVRQERITEYGALWLALRDAATARGAHAWHFLSNSVEGLFLEFLEFGSEEDIRTDPATIAAIQALHAAFNEPYPPPVTLEEWVEIPHAAGPA
ncbi:MAG TPA: hypothetical protein VFE05_23450 [Longimicrobiaceae bacterium]|nr:hypothetical protein [Longimicrobiaceae bacterium]